VVDQRRAEVGANADLVDDRVPGEAGIVADVVEDEREPAYHHVRAEPVVAGHLPADLGVGDGLGGQCRAVLGVAGDVEAGEVLSVLVDEVDHRERGSGRVGQVTGEAVELGIRALGQAELMQPGHAPGGFGVEGGEQVACGWVIRHGEFRSAEGSRPEVGPRHIE
jgi:hypothetical protein